MLGISNNTHVATIISSLNKVYKNAELTGKLYPIDIYVLESIYKLLNGCDTSLSNDQRQLLIALYNTIITTSKTICKSNILEKHISSFKSKFTQAEIEDCNNYQKYPLLYNPLSLVNSLYIDFDIVLSEISKIFVDWGDGEITQYSGTTINITHIYSTNFTGVMKIACLTGNNKIIRLSNFSILNTTNSIAFTTQEIGVFTNLQSLSCLETNIISGDINNLPKTLLNIAVKGNNTLTGNIINLSNNIITLNIYGNNTLSGNLINLPNTLTFIDIQGSNIITGDIINIPSNVSSISIGGNNTLYGDIINLKVILTFLNITGNNTITGDITNFPINMTAVRLDGNNTLYGDIINIPSTITSITVEGSNTITGDISSLPINMTAFIIGGNNTVFGNIANLPINIRHYNVRGYNGVVNYTSGRVWSNNMLKVRNTPISPLPGLSSSEVDNLLIDLALVSTWNTTNVFIPAEINIGGVNAARTSASDSAVTTLISKGVLIITN